ncbi:MAG: AraC family transcriptional regulator [Bullifex sp.]
MARFRDLNHFSRTTKEEFLPVHLLTDGILGRMGIWAGGHSLLSKGSEIIREQDRPFHIMIVSLSGEGRFVMEDGTAFTLSPGEFFFSSSYGQGHRHSPLSDKWELCWIQIKKDAQWLTNVPDDYMHARSVCSSEIHDCFKSIIHEEEAQRSGFVFIQELTSQLLIEYMKRELNLTATSGRSMDHIRRFNELWRDVTANVGDRWDLEEMCAYMNMSRAHLIRLCREYYGMTPTAKVHEIKMSHANSMLRTLGYTVSEVAEQTGYESLSAFTSAFRKFYGFTPSKLS